MSGVQVKVFSEPALRTQLVRQLPGTADEGLDMAIVPNYFLGQLHGRGILAEVPLALADHMRSALLRSAWAAVSEGERSVAVPINSDVVALLYHPGLLPQPPATIREIVEAKDFPRGVIPFSVNLMDPLSLAGYLLTPSGTQDLVSHHLDTSPRRVSAVMERLLLPGMRASDWWLFRGDQLESLQVQLFAGERLAALVARPRVIPTLELLGAPMAVIPTPPLAPGDEPVRQVVTYQCLVVSAGSPWVDLAFRLAARMIDEETQHRLNQISRQLPVLAASYRLRPAIMSPGLLGFLRAMEGGITYPMAIDWDRDIADLHGILEREITQRQERDTPAGGTR